MAVAVTVFLILVDLCSGDSTDFSIFFLSVFFYMKC